MKRYRFDHADTNAHFGSGGPFPNNVVRPGDVVELTDDQAARVRAEHGEACLVEAADDSVEPAPAPPDDADEEV